MIACSVVLGASEGVQNNLPTIIHSGCNIEPNGIVLSRAEVGHCCRIGSFSVVSG